MRTTFTERNGTRIAILAAATMLAACVDEAPFAPEAMPEAALASPAMAVAVPEADIPLEALPQAATDASTLATLRRATAPYHELEAALADGFVFLHPCEVRPGEGPVGIVYVHPDRIADGVVDPSLPDGLVYAPAPNGGLRLAAAELVVPLDVSEDPPTFLGATFQEEEEFGVWGLHVWLWIHNPNGLFAPANPRIAC